MEPEEQTAPPVPAPPVGGPVPAPPYASAPVAPVDPSALAAPYSADPVVEAEYQQLLRGTQHRWWRPLLSLLILAATYVATQIAVAAVFMSVGFALGRPATWMTDVVNRGPDDPVMMLLVDLTLIAFIPCALLAVRGGHRVPMGTLCSVAGRFRWRWWLTCLAGLAPLWLAYIGIDWWVNGYDVPGRSAHWGWLVLMALVLTPFQCAGEEFVFRGWIMQSIGSWFAQRWVALGVGWVLSAVLFSLAHTSMDPWILAQLATFATAAVFLTWYTGGLEAAVALHLVNNVILMVVGALTGTGADSMIDQDTTSSPVPAVTSLVAHVLAVALVVWLARRTGVARTRRMHLRHGWGAPRAGLPPAGPGPVASTPA